jgi:hypothetical protein
MDRQAGKFEFECDGCSNVLATGTGDFTAAKELHDAEGWRVRQIAGEWEHFCPRCSKR